MLYLYGDQQYKLKAPDVPGKYLLNIYYITFIFHSAYLTSKVMKWLQYHLNCFNYYLLM